MGSGGKMSFCSVCLYLLDYKKSALSSASSFIHSFVRSRELIHKVMATPSQPAKIFDWCYLGSADHAKDLAMLQTLGFSTHRFFIISFPPPHCLFFPVGAAHVLNVSDNVDNFHEKNPNAGLAYLKLGVKDFGMDEKGIGAVLVQGYEFLETVRQSPGKKVLVHCMQGRNRSVTMVAAFLIEKCRMELKEAINHIRTTRPNIAVARDNREELVRLEVLILGVSTMSVDDFVVQRQAYQRGLATSSTPTPTPCPPVAVMAPPTPTVGMNIIGFGCIEEAEEEEQKSKKMEVACDSLCASLSAWVSPSAASPLSKTHVIHNGSDTVDDLTSSFAPRV